MTTGRTRREKVYTGDNLWQWRDVPLAMDAALEEDDEDDQDERDHEAAMGVALNAYRDHREALDRKRGQDGRRGRDSDDPTPDISHRPEHQPSTGSRSERALMAGDSAARTRSVRRQVETMRGTLPGLRRLGM